ncbi:MAG: hypothetical protein B6D56_01895, partial [Candidatus Omnitrophica bacterium 4484_70.1]
MQKSKFFLLLVFFVDISNICTFHFAFCIFQFALCNSAFAECRLTILNRNRNRFRKLQSPWNRQILFHGVKINIKKINIQDMVTAEEKVFSLL